MLGHALAGRTGQGLFFRGAGRLPFGREIRPVLDLMQWLLGGLRGQPEPGAAAA
jgi:nitronate monooxygenase